MERDFMGLNSKEPLSVVKEEITETPLESCSGVPWSFMNKASDLPHFMSSKTGQDDRTMKMAPVPVSFPGFMPTPIADAFDHCQKPPMGEIQQDSQSLNSIADINMSAAEQASTFSVSSPFFKPNFATSGQNLVGNTIIKQQFLGGVPTTVPFSLGPIVGKTEPWNNFEAFVTQGQMTIFYAGSVNVYDDISPEKVQAIMLLAGNGSSLSFNKTHQGPQLQVSTTKLADADGVIVNESLNTQPCPHLSSHLSVPSHNIVHSGRASTGSNGIMVAKTSGVSTTPVSKPEPQRIVSSLSPIPVTAMIPSALPQYRKASLARFLEKRKERVMSVGPYNCEKKPPESTASGNNDTSLCATSGSPSGGKEN